MKLSYLVYIIIHSILKKKLFLSFKCSKLYIEINDFSNFFTKHLNFNSIFLDITFQLNLHILYYICSDMANGLWFSYFFIQI